MKMYILTIAVDGKHTVGQHGIGREGLDFLRRVITRYETLYSGHEVKVKLTDGLGRSVPMKKP